jgi:alkylation response protein AidB-like acyl-CoA dehydrogenase
VVLGGLCILEAASEKQKRELLPRIASGDLILALALTEPSAGYEPASINMPARADKESYVIDGTKLFVADANTADYLVCVTRSEDRTTEEAGITLFLVDARSPGIEYSLLKTIDGSKQCEVSFNNVDVPRDNQLGELGQGWSVVEKVLARAKVAKCAEMVGGISRVLEMSQQYAKERVQFGRPIGVNQAIQFHCANMVIDADIARFLTYKAAWHISESLPCAKEVAAAKAWVSDAYLQVTYLGQLVHGGIGFCLEHDLSLYIKRAKAAEVTFGDAGLHREVIAQELGL